MSRLMPGLWAQIFCVWMRIKTEKSLNSLDIRQGEIFHMMICFSALFTSLCNGKK
jgi:hypothetical protein